MQNRALSSKHRAQRSGARLVAPLGERAPRCALLFCSVFLAAAATLSAHHSFGAEYDANKPVTLTGVITKVDWTNPHSYFYMDVRDKDGKVANWKFEGYPPSVLYRTGWKRGVTLKEGDKITVFGWQARDGTNWAHSREVTFQDGKKLYFGPPAGTGDGGNAPPVEAPKGTNE